jgi:hypothetical protein
MKPGFAWTGALALAVTVLFPTRSQAACTNADGTITDGPDAVSVKFDVSHAQQCAFLRVMPVP